MALQGHLCEVKLATTGTAMTDEATTTSDNTIYQVTDSAKRILDLNTTVLVEDGGVATTESYTLDYLNGKVTFDSADAGRTITVTGAYLTPATVATADEYDISITGDVLENTAFNQTFRTYQAGLVTGTATLGRFHVADDLFIDPLLNSDYVIIEIYPDASHPIRAYGVISDTDVDSPVDELIKESVDFQLTNQIEVS